MPTENARDLVKDLRDCLQRNTVYPTCCGRSDTQECCGDAEPTWADDVVAMLIRADEFLENENAGRKLSEINYEVSKGSVVECPCGKAIISSLKDVFAGGRCYWVDIISGEDAGITRWYDSINLTMIKEFT